MCGGISSVCHRVSSSESRRTHGNIHYLAFPYSVLSLVRPVSVNLSKRHSLLHTSYLFLDDAPATPTNGVDGDCSDSNSTQDSVCVSSGATTVVPSSSVVTIASTTTTAATTTTSSSATTTQPPKGALKMKQLYQQENTPSKRKNRLKEVSVIVLSCSEIFNATRRVCVSCCQNQPKVTNCILCYVLSKLHCCLFNYFSNVPVMPLIL